MFRNYGWPTAILRIAGTLILFVFLSWYLHWLCLLSSIILQNNKKMFHLYSVKIYRCKSCLAWISSDYFKNTMICFNWKEAIWSLTKKKTRNKKEKLTESLHLTVKIARRSNYNIDLRKLRVNKITGRRNHKAAPNEKPTDSPQWFFIRSSI